ncbi:MaoC/PaaZ C-terminal domain-containing protein [Demequina sp. NBRC 110055]|uniref:MaoC/PaaZ C-terminal domain-containing protein n=1 Tax=Demequina sp. NBRC 110055 TaxID=1570344 RepID=UPI0009FF91FE|nr:MaoC/PaaZ C-terminal domain-containing protein [Demequina sp. NBRC 110055]
MTAVVTLDSPPGMGRSVARALLPSRASVARVPEHVVRLAGVIQDRARLADYSRVTGLTLRDTVPPTWIHVLAFPLHVHLLSDAHATVRLVGAVHVSNTMRLQRPVSADEALDLAVHATTPRAHRRGALVDLVARAEVGGDVVWQGTSTYLATGMRAEGTPQDAPHEPFEPRALQGRWRLSSTLGRDYRRVSGDPNPIHTSRVAAKAFGFARPIIHGMWTHARALAALEQRLPSTYGVEVDFAKPILLPGTVGFRAADAPGGWDADVTTPDGAKPHLRMRVRP